MISNMTLWTQEDPEVAYPSQDAVWKRFEQAFLATLGLVSYAPVFKDYYHESLSQFYRDNVMYVEVRALLTQVNVCHKRRCAPVNLRGLKSIHLLG